MSGTVKVSVPGKIMLAGEYAVLRGGSALACTVDQSLQISIQDAAWPDDIMLDAKLWDERALLTDFSRDPRRSAEALVETLQACRKDLDLSNCECKIGNELDPNLGVGSSSALRFGTFLAARSFQAKNALAQPDLWDAARQSFLLQRSSQGQGSGYDVVTQLSGGCICLQPAESLEQWPGVVIKIKDAAQILNQFVHIYVNRNGAATGPLSRKTIQWLDDQLKWDELKANSEALVCTLAELLTTRDLSSPVPIQSIIPYVKSIRTLLNQSPAAHPLTNEIAAWPKADQEWTFKPTGAGGEDAILFFATPEHMRELEYRLSSVGLSLSNLKFAETKTEVNRH